MQSNKVTLVVDSCGCGNTAEECEDAQVIWKSPIVIYRRDSLDLDVKDISVREIQVQ
jgi:hypothetical protein